MRRLLLSPYSVDEKSFGLLGDIPLMAAMNPSVLYWDQVDVPIPMPGSLPIWEQLLDHLIAEGAVRKYPVQSENVFDSSYSIRLFANDFLSRISAAGESREEVWSIFCPAGNNQSLIHFFSRIANVPISELKKHQTIEIALRDALPVPPSGTAIQEILEFKRSRQDELAELNATIDRLSVQLSGVPSVEDAVQTGKGSIEKALKDIDKVMSEKWTKRILSTLRTNLPSIATGAILGGAAAPTFDAPILVGAAGGGLIKPVLQATLSAVLASPKIPERATPFLYAYHAQQELKPRS